VVSAELNSAGLSRRAGGPVSSASVARFGHIARGQFRAGRRLVNWPPACHPFDNIWCQISVRTEMHQVDNTDRNWPDRELADVGQSDASYARR
jgi:hypothetical protein